MGAAVRLIGDKELSKGKKSLLGYERGTIGTGFLFGFPSEFDPKLGYGYVATAHHVVKWQERVEVQAPYPLDVGKLQPSIRVVDWHQPIPDYDLAIATFDGRVDNRWAGLSVQQSFLPEQVDPLLASPIHYIGMFEPLDTPMVRTGSLGSLYHEGMKHQGPYDYSAHLVDCRSYGGFSGSPCFVEFDVPRLEKETPPFAALQGDDVPRGSMDYASLFCGMFTEYVEDGLVDAASKYGVGVMLPSRLIWEALTTPEMTEVRRMWHVMNSGEDEPEGCPRQR